MSAPRPKRQFAGAASDPAQRSITSFFTTHTNTPGTHSGLISSSTTQPCHNLPASVQANLLSVGMRVRKSVPEGYKTGNYSAFALWDENFNNITTITTEEATLGQCQRSKPSSSGRELLPFCGIHKVGGLDTQPEEEEEDYDDDLHPIPSLDKSLSITPPDQLSYPCDEDMSGLVQNHTKSRESSTPTPRTKKRFFVEDEESEPQLNNIWRQLAINPRSLAPTDNNSGRAIAVPRKGRGKSTGVTVTTTRRETNNNMVGDHDFEEAEFLDQATWEVDMLDT